MDEPTADAASVDASSAGVDVAADATLLDGGGGAVAGILALACPAVPVPGASCERSGAICRQATPGPGQIGDPCRCSSARRWICATTCPAATTSGVSCPATNDLCARAAPSAGEVCGCGNHQTWDCLNVCAPGTATGQACKRGSGYAGNQNFCFLPGAAEGLCHCRDDKRWTCAPSCPTGTTAAGSCAEPGRTCVRVTLTGLWLHDTQDCACDPSGTWTCTKR